jgi:hypothetical protein
VQVNCTVHMSASELHCSREQCNSQLNSSELHCPQVSTVHAKHVFIAFSFQRFKRKKHVDPMHNKVSFLITKRLRTAF